MQRLLWLFVTCLTLPDVPAADWPQFLGPRRNGIAGETNPLPAWPASGPRVLWKADVGSGWSGPVVQGERLVICHREGDTERVDALEARTGRRVWRHQRPATYEDDFRFDDGPRATPTIADGRVYTFGADGVLQCLSLTNGRVTWSVDLAATMSAEKGFFGRAGSPLVTGDLVVLNIGGGPGAGIVALDRLTGRERWRSTDDGASYSSPVEADFGGRRGIGCLTRTRFVVLDPADGAVRSAAEFRPSIRESVSAAVPLVVADGVLLTVSYGAGARRLKYAEPGLSVVWRNEDLAAHYNTPVIVGGHVYGIDGRQERGCQLRCLDWATGAVRWTEERLGASSLIGVGGQLLILTEGGELLLVPATPERFQARSRSQVLGAKVRAHPALADGRLFARDTGRLVAWELRP